jgi:transposase
MRQQSNSAKDPVEKVVKDIRRATRKQYSAEEKIRMIADMKNCLRQRATSCP